MKAQAVSFWKVFRLVFVIFSLYLLGDAFYRWDGFRYYASFSEILPSIALVFILWSITALLTTLVIWLLLKSIVWFCKLMGCNVEIVQLVLFIFIFMLLAMTDIGNANLLIFHNIKLLASQKLIFLWDKSWYYASLYEFLPSLVIVSILGSILAALTVLVTWLSVKSLDWFCKQAGLEIKKHHLLLILCLSILLVVIFWSIRKLVIPENQLIVKQIIFLFTSVFLTWKYRDRAMQWMNDVWERITPLVWLFGISAVFFLLLVSYHIILKQSDNKLRPGEITRTSVADDSNPNIILVIFDALTARDMSLYGFKRETTPFISKWSETASLFTRTYSLSNFTTPSVASLMTGKRVWTHRTYHLWNEKPLKGDVESLPYILKRNGYYNMAFVANPAVQVENLGMSNSFEYALPARALINPMNLVEKIDNLLYVFDNKIKFHHWFLEQDFLAGMIIRRISGDYFETSVSPEIAFDRFLKKIDQNPHRPYFAWIHIFPPHDPYLPSEPYMGSFNSSLEFTSYKSQYNLEGIDTGMHQSYPEEVQPIVDILRARYDEFIMFCDHQFENFIEQLKKRDKLKNTIIILSADHGESFEHNYLGHRGPYLYEQLTNIPLIIKMPDQTEGRIITSLISQVDIPATIIDMARIPVPLWMEGRSIKPLLFGENLPEWPVFSMNLEKNKKNDTEITKGTFAVWDNEYKLTYNLDKEESSLYNLEEDPDEMNNLFDKESETGQRLLDFIKDNLQKANERIRSGT